MLPRYRCIALLTGLALAAACASEPAETARAREILAAKIVEDAGYHEYALTIMAGSTARHARDITLKAIAEGNRTLAGVAIRGLEGAPDEETRAALRLAFGKVGSQKLAAAAVLATDGDAEALEWLAGQLAQSGYLLLTPAMVALAESEHEEAVRNSLAVLVTNDEISIRNEGYAILGAIRRPWAMQMLLAGLENEFGEARGGPIAALGQSGDPSVSFVIRSWVGTQGLVLASLQALGTLGHPDSLESVRPLLDHEQALVRVYAAVAAARLGAEEAASAAVDGLLADDDPATRGELAVQLASLEGQAATGWLTGLTGDADKSVRAEACRGLIGRGDSGLVEVLASAAQDPAYEVATVALTGLARNGSADQVAALTPLLESDNPYLAISAAHAVLSLSPDPSQAKVD